MTRTYIIAEIGVNHNGSLALAKQLVDEAISAGVDAVKFQTFKAEHLVSKHAPKAEYQLSTTEKTESQLEMLKKLELTYDEFIELWQYCGARHVDFLSTPFDMESLHFLTDAIPMPIIKVASGEITNAPFLFASAATQRHIILSTGMSTVADIRRALGVIACGYLGWHPASEGQSHEDLLAKAYASAEGQRLLRERVTILHCTTEYPAPFNEINLHVIPALATEFALNVGYSDHTVGIEVPIAAVALGAKVIEKHFTLDKSMEGPDHRASLEPHELREMVRAIRNIESALGSSEKRITPAEAKNQAIARKSVVVAAPIRAGELISEHHLIIKRPGTGISPFFYWKLLGTVAKRDYQCDELIDSDQLS